MDNKQTCTICHKNKKIDVFKGKKNNTQYFKTCDKCRSVNKIRYEKRKTYLLAYHKKWHVDNYKPSIKKNIDNDIVDQIQFDGDKCIILKGHLKYLLKTKYFNHFNDKFNL